MKEKPILFLDKEECCGCSACYSICPHEAIEMVSDEEGFLYPMIKDELCIQCNKCIKVCTFKKAQQRYFLPDNRFNCSKSPAYRYYSDIKKIIKGYITWILPKNEEQKRIYRCRRAFLSYHKMSQDNEIKAMVKYIKKYKSFDMMNCELTGDYNKLKVDISFDEESNMYFVEDNNKKLYFKEGLGKEKIVSLYRILKQEQDKNSSHRYLTESDLNRINRFKHSNKQSSDIRLFEFGAMEGMFSLNLVEIVDEIHIFECDEGWSKALAYTFRPYRNKVRIVNKYVSYKTDKNHISLERYLEQIPKRKFSLEIVKMDIEGAEVEVLNGMKNFMKEAQSFYFFVCTYHRKNDEVTIRSICKDYQIEEVKGGGYFCFYVADDYEPPYVRRCMLKVTKNV